MAGQEVLLEVEIKDEILLDRKLKAIQYLQFNHFFKFMLIFHVLDQGWNYYDAFSMILLKQTDAVLECGSECFNKLTPEQRSEGVNPVSVIGTKENVKNCIRVLYSNYMGKIAKISKPIETEAEVASNMTARAEEPSIIPEWLLPTEETKKPEKTDTFIFAPPKA